MHINQIAVAVAQQVKGFTARITCLWLVCPFCVGVRACVCVCGGGGALI